MRTKMVTYRLRAYCDKPGYTRLAFLYAMTLQLYNAMLFDKRIRWRCFREPVSHSDQSVALTRLRAICPALASVDRQVVQETLRRLDRAYDAFFRRVKDGEEPGFPRMKGANRWHGLGTENAKPYMVRRVSDGRYNIRIKGLPLLRVRTNRELPDSTDIRKIMIKRDGRRYWVCLTYKIAMPDVADTPVFPIILHNAIGIDMGVSVRAAFSDGSSIVRVRKNKRRKRRLQRRISRAQKGSSGYKRKRRDHARECGRIALRHRQATHRQTTAIVRNHDFIAFEKLEIPNMTKSARGTVEKPGKNVAQKRGLNREILEQSWGEFQRQLQYKAEWAGKATWAVDPKYTSQTCSGCGVVDKSQRKKRRYDCRRCGLSIDADHNAAINILRRAIEEAAGRVGIKMAQAV